MEAAMIAIGFFLAYNLISWLRTSYDIDWLKLAVITFAIGGCLAFWMFVGTWFGHLVVSRVQP